MFEAVPKLRNKRKALGWRQTDNLIGRKQFHSFENSRKVRGREGRKLPFIKHGGGGRNLTAFLSNATLNATGGDFCQIKGD